jgi:predicted transcriptional regulator
MSTTIEISDNAERQLEELVEETGDTEQEVLERALDAFEEKLYADQFQEDFADLHARGDAWGDDGASEPF